MEVLSLNRVFTEFIFKCQDYKIQRGCRNEDILYLQDVKRNTSNDTSDKLCPFHIFKTFAKKFKHLKSHPMMVKGVCTMKWTFPHWSEVG